MSQLWQQILLFQISAKHLVICDKFTARQTGLNLLSMGKCFFNDSEQFIFNILVNWLASIMHVEVFWDLGPFFIKFLSQLAAKTILVILESIVNCCVKFHEFSEIFTLDVGLVVFTNILSIVFEVEIRMITVIMESILTLLMSCSSLKRMTIREL